MPASPRRPPLTRGAPERAILDMITPHRLAALAAVVALTACARPAPDNAAPDFSLTSPAGSPVSLSQQRGKVVLLNFWATWCDSCRAELPALRALAKDSRGRFVVLAVSVDDDPARVVPPFLAREKLDFPVAYADPAVLDAYAVRDLPTTFLIGPDGAIRGRYVGPLDASSVENDILQLLRRPS